MSWCKDYVVRLIEIWTNSDYRRSHAGTGNRKEIKNQNGIDRDGAKFPMDWLLQRCALLTSSGVWTSVQLSVKGAAIILDCTGRSRRGGGIGICPPQAPAPGFARFSSRTICIDLKSARYQRALKHASNATNSEE